MLPTIGANVYDILNHDVLAITTAGLEGLKARINGTVAPSSPEAPAPHGPVTVDPVSDEPAAELPIAEVAPLAETAEKGATGE